MKYTIEQAQEQEKISLIEALGNGLELNDEFLDLYAGEALKTALKGLDESDRAYVLDSYIDDDKAYFNGSITSLTDNGFLLPCGEIEIQFEGEASDFFEKPEDWTIDGNLAYYYVGYGLTIEVDIDGLKEEIENR